MRTKDMRLALAVLAMSTPPAFAGTLTLVTPNGGERLCPGSTYEVRWTSSGLSAPDIRLVLFRLGSRLGNIVNSVPASAGSHIWTVGEHASGTAVTGSGYTILIATNAGSEKDESNQAFAIANPWECGAPDPWGDAETGHFVPGEMIVRYLPNTVASVPASQAAALGATVKSLTSTPDGVLVLMQFPPDGRTMLELVSTIESGSRVVYAEPNFIVSSGAPIRPARAHPTDVLRIRTGVDEEGRPTYRDAPRSVVNNRLGTFPSEDLALDQWGWYDSGASVIWSDTRANQMVAVLDTGIDYLHPDLAGLVTKGRDYVNSDADPMDDNGTGTHVAGIISALANNRIGISGMSRAKILAIKVLDSSGSGTHYTAAQGLYAAYASTARIVVLGWGGPGEGRTLRDAVRRVAITGNRLVIAAAGDSGTDVPQYPAAYSSWVNPAPTYTFTDRVLAVAAAGRWLTPSGGGADVFVEYTRAPSSNFGTWTNIVAPGTDIYSTTPYQRAFANLDAGDSPDGYNRYSGTPMAAAFVAGAAARVWGTLGGTSPIPTTYRLTGHRWPALVAFTGAVDLDGDSTNEVDACWDPAWALAAGGGRTRDLVMLNVAHAMGRSAVWGRAYDASSALGLVGGQARLVSHWTCPLVVRVGNLIGADGLPNANEFDITNVSWTACEFSVRINKVGYTNSPIGFAKANVNGHVFKRQVYYQAEDIAVPPIEGYFFVVNWGDGTTRPINLDAHMMLGLTAGAYADVGPAPPLASNPEYFYGNGSMTAPPYLELRTSSEQTGLNFEALCFGKGGRLYITNDVPYHFFVVSREPTLPTTGFATARIWTSGVMSRQVRMGETTIFQSSPLCSFAGGDADCSNWLTLTLSMNANRAITLTRVDEVGDGVNLAPIPF